MTCPRSHGKWWRQDLNPRILPPEPEFRSVLEHISKHRQGGAADELIVGTPWARQDCSPAPPPSLLLPYIPPRVPTYPTAWVSRVQHGMWPGVEATNLGRDIFILELMGCKFWVKGHGLKFSFSHQPL